MSASINFLLLLLEVMEGRSGLEKSKIIFLENFMKIKTTYLVYKDNN